MPAINAFKSFEALDSCHRDIQRHLIDMTALTERLSLGKATDPDRKLAGNIASFFSNEARNHHAQEEENVFPGLLLSENTELVAKVKELIQDHFWIEKYWRDLEPVLIAISEDAQFDTAAFDVAAKRFIELVGCHLECEETMIYPEAKTKLRARPGF